LKRGLTSACLYFTDQSQSVKRLRAARGGFSRLRRYCACELWLEICFHAPFSMRKTSVEMIVRATCCP